MPCKINANVGYTIIKNRIQKMEFCKEILAISENVIKDMASEIQLYRKSFDLEITSIEKLYEWIMSDGRKGQASVAFISDDDYRVEIYFTLTNGDIKTNSLIDRIKDGHKETYNFQAGTWEDFSMTKSQKENIDPTSVEFEFLSLLMDVFGPFSDIEYACIKRKHGKLLRLARKLPKKMMRFAIYNDLTKINDEIEGESIQVVLIPANSDINGFAIKQEWDTLQICQYFKPNDFAEPRDQFCRPVINYDHEGKAIPYVMSILDHYFPNNMYLIPLSENSYMRYENFGKKSEIISKGELTTKDQKEIEVLNDFLTKYPLWDLK